MIRLRSINNDEYRNQAKLIEAFLVLDTNDKPIAQAMEKVINAKDEIEVHNAIAGLSYSMPNYGISVYPLYYADKIKIALAAVIMQEYMKAFGAREGQKVKVFNGKAVSIESYFLQAISVEAVEKNLLAGIHFQTGEMPTKHIKTKPGAPRLKVCKRLKTVAKAVSSMGLRIVSDISKDQVLSELLKGKDYLASLDPKGKKLEHRIAMKARFIQYSELFELMQTKSRLAPLYLSVNFDYRGRMYYDVSLQVLNPQSKLGKFMYEANTSRKLSALDYKNLAFAAASSVSRCKLGDGVAIYEANEASIRAKLLEEDDFLALTYNKRLMGAIDAYKAGEKSRFLLLLDYTTGGLIHFSSGYTQEKKSMVLANIVDGEDMQDTHQSIADPIAKITGLDISRKDAKNINQSILAGSTMKSATKKFNAYFGDEVLTEEQLTKVCLEVYGETALVFSEFNNWGKGLLDNDNSSLKWTASDGVKCMSSAYIKGQEVKLYIPTTSGMKQMSIFRNMPLLIENSSQKPLLVGKEASAKMYGFLANTTHGEDGTDIRAIVMALAEEDMVGIFIHDNIGAFGIAHETCVRPTAKIRVQERFASKYFLDIQTQVANNRVGSYIKPMDYSVCDIGTLVISDNFLQA
jgi:hypothetical protein